MMTAKEIERAETALALQRQLIEVVREQVAATAALAERVKTLDRTVLALVDAVRLAAGRM